MEENPHRVSRRSQGGAHWRSSGAEENHQSDDGDGVKCSGKKCRSAAAAAIADCVALCCCPCAVVNLLTLAFVKVPWMIGRRCLGGGRVGRRRRRRGEDGFRRATAEGEDDHSFVVERDGSLTKEEDKTASFGAEDEDRISARVEAERVWLELYQIGHLGFGRVSFTGIQ
ncbi:PREDICTED: uncharacterized protein LOC104821080 [Tarenaya hassleriana]|uniref:uncharacterized protein LOC104821080 n=1 Tax=Tarenaya hassleriana TaxID=28532 RepID=UPI00053C1B0F|nr:PREDICTED: uncharacterized protein LOC104821080 [Tarenaya hassleriana]XP_010550137.1 PREDICTED: uncharacterized protein LOC104821080 [Tarenaya hassleriana]